MATTTSPIRKQSAASSQNTRDISLLDLNKTSISVQECLELDTTFPLRDLDKDRQKIPYSLAALKQPITFSLAQTNVNEVFFWKFREQLTLKQSVLFRSVKKGRMQEMKAILKEYPIPITVKQTKHYGNSLLHESLKHQHLDISLWLLQTDIGLVNQQNSQGRTPVHFAMMYIRELFLGLLDDHYQQIDWAVTDEHKTTYDEYVQFYNYESVVCKRVREAVRAAERKNNKLQKEKQRPFFSPVSYSLKKYFSEALIQTQTPQLRNAKSHFIERPKRISSMFDIKLNIFSVETTISDFIIINELGQGCFAKVYKVKHIPSGNIYAMKVFMKSKITHQIMKYIISQKNLLMRLNHPFLINAYCFFQTPDLYCYVMDCCQGTLKDILNKQKQLSQNKIKQIACELISVLGYLHQNGVIYRDLKPDNIAFDESRHICLIDFGLSKDGLTGRSFCGSYLYLPPQMISSQQYNCVVDWYMLGAVLYELSTGKTPFLATDKKELVQKIMRQEHKQLSGVSLEMIDFVDSLLLKNHNNRLGAEEDCYQLMQHPWFDDIEWNSIPKRRYKISVPPAAPVSHKKIINQNAETYFSRIVEHKEEYDFIQVSRWNSVKQLH